MRLPHLAFAAALGLAACEAGASVARDALPGRLIRSCLSALSAHSDAEGHSVSHKFDLNQRCPQLARRLASSLDVEDIGSLSIDATSIEGLRDLQYFASEFGRQPVLPEKFSPNFDGLDALLADVLIENTIDDGLWERFLRWLEQYVKDGESTDLRRLFDWLEALDAPPWLADVILKSSVVLIVLLALFVIGNELRLAGLPRLALRSRKIQAPDATRETAPSPRARSLDELRGLPPRQLAAAILEIVTATFADRGWLSSNSSLTNGELVRQIRQRESSLSGPFTSLVNGIETIIYGDRLPDDDDRQRLFATAGELIERARAGTAEESGRTR